MITLSRRELDRLGVVQAVAEGKLKQRRAAEQLGVSTRQLKRLTAVSKRGHCGTGLPSSRTTE
jgi:hypothetical protein